MRRTFFAAVQRGPVLRYWKGTKYHARGPVVGRIVKPRLELHASSFTALWYTCKILRIGHSKLWEAKFEEQFIALVYNWAFSRYISSSGFHPPFLFKLEMKMAAHEEVEFKTLDGLTLRGWLYPASKRGPGVIITPGVSQSQFRLLSSSSLHMR